MDIEIHILEEDSSKKDSAMEKKRKAMVIC